jgi:hypothetical protein
MVVVIVLCGTRIKCSHVLIHLAGGDLVGGIEEGGELEWWILFSVRVSHVWCEEIKIN